LIVGDLEFIRCEKANFLIGELKELGKMLTGMIKIHSQD
jgi:hypothetical protein